MARVRTLLAAFGRAVRGVLDALWSALSSDPDDRPWERAAVRIVVPFAFVSATLVATLVAYRTSQPPEVAFDNHLIFAGELLLLGFYGLLLVLVPLVRAIGGGELPIELTARGARFAERIVEDSAAMDQEISERLEFLEEAMADQEATIKGRALQATDGMHDFEDELDALRGRFDELERQAQGSGRDTRKNVSGQ
jgi:uncharacterized coiled-coil protein SlyX